MTSFVKIGPFVLKKIYLFFVDYFICYFLIISPWKTARPFIFNNLNAHHPIMHYFQVWLKSIMQFLRRRWKCEKFTDEQTDDEQPINRKANLSFQLRLAKDACHLTTFCLIFSGTILFYMNPIRGGEYLKTTYLYNPTWRAPRDHRPWSG